MYIDIYNFLAKNKKLLAFFLNKKFNGSLPFQTATKNEKVQSSCDIIIV